MSTNTLLEALLRNSLRPTKPRIFVSYHHRYDQAYADRFARLFDDSYDAVTDRSLDADIENRLAELPARQWESLYLTVVKGMTERQAANVAEVSRSAVTGSRDRALQVLRDPPPRRSRAALHVANVLHAQEPLSRLAG